MITCWPCQRIVSAHMDAGAALPDWTRRHLENCSDCRTFYESGIAVAQRLSVSAAGEKREPSPFLHGKIMSAIRSEGNAARQPAPARWGWAMAVSAACVVAVSVVWLNRPPAAHPLALIPAPAPPVLNALTPAPPVQVDQWLKTSEAPLENETQLVLNDAKTAMNTLAKSFLPDDLLASSAKNGAQ
jgi:hypothetical protein